MGKKLGEAEARILALRIAASLSGNEATTSQIKDEAPKLRQMSVEDLVQSPTRGNEHKWEQIMGNVISHKNSSTSIFSRGYAERTDDGIRITEAGLVFLKSKGF